MPWSTPSAKDIRKTNAEAIAAKTRRIILPNSEVAAIADANAGNASLALEALDWQSKQYLPDTAESQFLDRWGNLYLTNADGSVGRKVATYASGLVTVTGVPGTVLPAGSQFTSSTTLYQTTAPVTLSAGATPVQIRALDAGSAGNLSVGASVVLQVGVVGITGSGNASVVSITGGSDEETDDELRARVLERIQQPPMGGDANDYEQWALSVAGVTRAWCSPMEMGIGTVTVRFMMDDLRATNDPATSGLPNAQDIAKVEAYLNSVRPVTVKDIFVRAPVTQKIDFGLTNLANGSLAVNAAIRASVSAMLKARAAPGHAFNGVAQPAVDIPRAWVDEAIFVATGGAFFDLDMDDAIMASNGCMAVLGTIKFG